MDSANASAAIAAEPAKTAASGNDDPLKPTAQKTTGGIADVTGRKLPPGATDGVVKLAAVNSMNASHASNARTKVTPPLPGSSGALMKRVEIYAFQISALLIVGALGWTIGANSFDRSRPDAAVVEAIRALDAKIQAVAARSASAGDVAMVRNGVDEISRSLEIRGNTSSALADLNLRVDTVAKIQVATQDKLLREQADRFDQISGRLDHLERQATDPMPTASIRSTVAAPLPASSPTPATAAAPSDLDGVASKKLPPNGYVLRAVSGQFATIEGNKGLQRVARGDFIPGAGRVRSIERRGHQWVVITTRGEIDATAY